MIVLEVQEAMGGEFWSIRDIRDVRVIVINIIYNSRRFDEQQ